MGEYKRISKSLEEYSIPKKEDLAKIIYKKVKNKPLEEIIWDFEGGKGRPLAFYYDKGWKSIEEYNGNEIEAIEVIRKAKNAPDFKKDSEKDYWRIRKVKYTKKDGKLVPEQNWMVSPSEETRIVRDIVGEVYHEVFKKYPYLEVTLFGSALNGTMNKNSDLEYSLLIYEEKMWKDEEFKEIFKRELTELRNDPYVTNEKEAKKGAYIMARSKVTNKIMKMFINNTIKKAKERGINLDEGYSYIAYIRKGKLYERDYKQDNDLRLVYSIEKGGLLTKYVDYNIYSKFRAKSNS